MDSFAEESVSLTRIPKLGARRPTRPNGPNLSLCTGSDPSSGTRWCNSMNVRIYGGNTRIQRHNLSSWGGIVEQHRRLHNRSSCTQNLGIYRTRVGTCGCVEHLENDLEPVRSLNDGTLHMRSFLVLSEVD